MPIKLTFTFESGDAPVNEIKTFQAEIELTSTQIENFFTLRSIARQSRVRFVEVFIPGVEMPKSAQHIEPGDVVVDDYKGIALNASLPNSKVPTLRSRWLDWGTLELINIFECEPSQGPVKSKAEEVARHELQSV